MIKKLRQELYQVHSVKAYVMPYHTVTFEIDMSLTGQIKIIGPGMPLETLIQDLKTPSMGKMLKQTPSAFSLGLPIKLSL